MKHEKWGEQGEGGNLDVVVMGAPHMNTFVYKIMQADFYIDIENRRAN